MNTDSIFLIIDESDLSRRPSRESLALSRASKTIDDRAIL